MFRITRQDDLVCVQGVFELELNMEFWRYAEMYRGQPYSVLLDSASNPERLGHYSFLIGEPETVFEARSVADDVSTFRWTILQTDTGHPLDQPLVKESHAEPFAELSRAFDQRRVEPWLDAPVPFTSGAVGYIAYEAAHFTEKLPRRAVDDLGIPQVCLLFTNLVWAHDHQSGKSYVLITARAAQESDARVQIDRHLQRTLSAKSTFEENSIEKYAAQADASPHAAASPAQSVVVSGHADQSQYVRTVLQAKEHIRLGDAFEVCTTHRLEAKFDGDSWDLYKNLRRINPAPFAAFLRMPWGEIVSSSPERFLRLQNDGTVEGRPIKGTRPRGKTPELDEKLRAELFGSVKDRAENIMIVDLVRNDLGRVCEIDSVEVSELMVIEQYATVFQMVSTIRGKLRQDRTPLDLLCACFPGGSMTGAPKIESMKIIDSLEPYVRGVYSGTIGYFDDSGALDLNIVIRTFVVKDKRCYFSVGGAVVYDSDPVAEYQETLDKAAALIRALNSTTTMGAQ